MHLLFTIALVYMIGDLINAFRDDLEANRKRRGKN